MNQDHSKISSNLSQLIVQNELTLPSEQQVNFKWLVIWNRLVKSSITKQLLRFCLYFVLGYLLLSILPKKKQESTLYSFVSNNSLENISLIKDVPGLFPALSTDNTQILGIWNIALIRGKLEPINYKNDLYQLEFKNNSLVYITKHNCFGHIVMNWIIYSHNIYITDFIQPKGSMTIPNLPKDEQCIKQKTEVIDLLKLSSIWTIKQENRRKQLFLLIQKIDVQNIKNNYVLIADEHLKA